MRNIETKVLGELEVFKCLTVGDVYIICLGRGKNQEKFNLND